MFPSSNNCDHVPFTNQAMITENENPSYSQQHHHHHSPFLHFVDQPFLADDNELFISHFFPQQQIFLGCSSNNNMVAETEIKMTSPVKPTKKSTTKKKKNEANGEKQAAPRKRTGKKDRHSKIYTAKGPRDRRMRLSLQIARKFFDLQDTLGFDKASKTIEWLFSKSKAAIKELTESLPSVKKSCIRGAKCTLSSTSESEVVSGIKKSEDSLVGIPRAGAMNRRRSSKLRESRDKARARARERTIEKMKMKMRSLEFDQKSKKHSDDQEANPNDLENNCSDLNVVADQEAAAEEEEKESGMVHLTEDNDKMDSVSIIEKFLGITTSPRSSSIFEYTLKIGESSSASSQKNHLAYSTEYNSYYAMTNMDGSSSGNNLFQAQNHPGEFFNVGPDTQERESSSIYIINSDANAHYQNTSSDFNKAILIAHEQNPSSIVMTSHPHFLEDQFSCNHIVHNKYSSLY